MIQTKKDAAVIRAAIHRLMHGPNVALSTTLDRLTRNGHNQVTVAVSLEAEADKQFRFYVQREIVPKLNELLPPEERVSL